MEEVIKCCDLEKVKDFGMTLEEFCIIARCNGAFTEAFRPDPKEEEREEDIINILKQRTQNENEKSQMISSNQSENKASKVIVHSGSNTECKNILDARIKDCNYDTFKAAVHASTRRENFFLVTNTSRKALNQTGEGHFSPVAAYNEKNDYVLQLDAARFKYHSMWFMSESIYNSFKRLDNSSKSLRGYVLVSRYY